MKLFRNNKYNGQEAKEFQKSNRKGKILISLGLLILLGSCVANHLVEYGEEKGKASCDKTNVGSGNLDIDSIKDSMTNILNKKDSETDKNQGDETTDLDDDKKSTSNGNSSNSSTSGNHTNSTTKPSTGNNNKPNSGGNNKPSDNNPGNNKPDDNKPGDNKPDDNKPGDNKPDDNKPDDNKPDDNKPEEPEKPKDPVRNPENPDYNDDKGINSGELIEFPDEEEELSDVSFYSMNYRYDMIFEQPSVENDLIEQVVMENENGILNEEVSGYTLKLK